MCGRTPRQMMLSQSLIDVKLSSHDLILKILANEKPEQLVAAFFLLCPSVAFMLFPCSGRKQLFPCQQVLPTSHQARPWLDQGTSDLDFSQCDNLWLELYEQHWRCQLIKGR